MAVRHVTKISSLTRPEVAGVLRLALDMKARPEDYHDALKRKTLLMLFEKPSLRTRVSLEAGMTSLGGHGIAYMTGDSPIGVKESYEDTGAVLSRMADAMLADLQTIVEHKGGDAPDVERELGGKALAFVGDCCNNVTYDLMRAGALMGLDVRVAGPTGEGFDAEPPVLEESRRSAAPGGGAVTVCATAEEAVSGADVVYADSWMSYGIEGAARLALAALMPFQVTTDLMTQAAPDAIFMNCLPAVRGEEQTADVIDGPQSVVFDQAENRLHAQKALLVKLICSRTSGRGLALKNT
ncbi:ornithine carbamoyltransferase [Aureococcus anophagefferens]|nr:ornithine carbamoyltransferase [Aureococcus anophagefferens]